MKAYVVATETVKDEATFAKYREAIIKTLEPFGARFVVRADAEGWYNSPEYQKIICERPVPPAT
jgi:uncharacterized protein (DUF1330 family)